MKRTLWMILLMVMTSCVGAIANSVTYSATIANFTMVPNDGSGDNVGFAFSGLGTNAILIGGVPASYFSDFFGFAPGSTGGGSTSFFPDYIANGNIGGYGYGSIELNDCCTAVLFVGAFTFPTNGQSNFSVTVPASLSGITGTITLVSGQTEQFSLNVKPFKLTLSFSYSPYYGVYYPNQATYSAVAEPATLALMGTGLIAIVGLLRRKLKA